MDYAKYGSTLDILIGAGGTGGPARTTDNTANGSATSGGSTLVRFPGQTTPLMNANGGGPSTGNAGGTGGFGIVSFINAISIAASTGNGVSGGSSSTTNKSVANLTGIGGAPGGGISATNFAYSGGSVGQDTSNSPIGAVQIRSGTNILTGSTANSGLPGPSANVIGGYHYGSAFMHGVGGAGSGSGATIDAAEGGNGYRGGGGGGGGASRNGFLSGAGGKGGDGYVCIWAWG
jgi:hypothetical protein